jgi:two-component system sensor histidine kinase UhpB
MVRLQSVGARLIAVILTVALPLAAAMCYFWWQALQEGRAREVALLDARVDQVRRELAVLTGQSEWIMSRMARRPAFRHLSAAACEDEMAVLRDVNPAFVAVTLWDRAGRLVCSSFPLKPGQPLPKPHRPSLEAGLASDGLYVSDVFPGQITGRNQVIFTYPVRDAAGVATGLLSVPVRSDNFARMLREAARDPGSVAGIVDRNAVIVARVPQLEGAQGNSIAQLVQDAQPSPDAAGALVSRGLDGIPRLFRRAVVPESGWRVFVGVEEARLLAGFRRQFAQGVAVLALVVAASLLLAYGIARSVAGPLRELVGVANAVAEGERGRRARASGISEVAQLSEKFNHMLDALGRAERSLSENPRRLAESEARYRDLAELSPDAILIHQDLRIVFVNRAMVELMRAARAEDLIGRSSLFMLPAAYVEEARRRSERLYAGERQPRAEQVYRALDGTPLEVEIASAPMVFDGRPAAQVTVREIGERKRLEAALRENESRYRRLAEFSPDAILLHQDMRVVFANPAMARLVRAASPEELVGRPSNFMLAPEDRESSRQRALALYAGQPQPRVERTYQRFDGTTVEVEVAAAPVELDGRPAAQVTVRDISARKQAERLLQASMARARELSARLMKAEEDERKRIAHDLHDQIGQELTALKIRLETLARSETAGASRTQMVEIAAMAGDALQRVRQISVDLRPPALDSLGLAAALRAHAERLSSIGRLRIHFDSRGFQRRAAPDVEIACFRIVQEALTNVLRHSGARNAWVELSAEGGVLTAVVRDDGQGFEEHRQGAAEGLGLAGMRERVAMTRGTLDIRAKRGQGCIVTATFPLSRET